MKKLLYLFFLPLTMIAITSTVTSCGEEEEDSALEEAADEVDDAVDEFD